MASSRTTRYLVLRRSGLVVFVLGICFALALIAAAWSPRRLASSKQRLDRQVHEVRESLVEIGVADAELQGLVYLYRISESSGLARDHYLLLSSLVLLSLVLSAFGLAAWGCGMALSSVLALSDADSAG